MNNQNNFFHNTENFKKVPVIPRPHSVIYRRPKSTVKRRSIYPKLNNSQISIPSIANNTSMKNTHASSFTLTNKLSSSLIDNKLRRNNSVQMKKLVTQYKNDFSLARSEMKKKELIQQKRIKSAMILGRNSEYADYVIQNPTIGRIHLLILRIEGKAYVIDMKSKNGTFLNGKQMDSMMYYEIKKGDILKLGKEKYRWMQES